MPQRTRKNLKIAVVGGAGRMGQELVKLIEAHPELSLAGSLDKTKTWSVDPSEVDVVIEFSLPQGMRQALKWCVKHKVPLVSGTTGLEASDLRALKSAARTLPILYSANMSLGIAVMSSMLKSFKAVNDWDFHVDEIHHNQKKDRPSGTAKLLDQRLAEVLERPTPAPNSIRGGGVPGLHQVWALGPEEMVMVQHTAFNRTVFARGALKAARWLFDKGEPGFYDLANIFDI